MDNISEKIQPEKSSYPELQNEIDFFDKLILDIKMRQVLFEKFEEYSINKQNDKSFPDNNDFCQMILRGYLIQQILDLAKFFDKDNKAYSFSFIVKHGANNFKEKHDELFNTWEEYGLKSVRNKVLAHSQKDFICSSVEKKVLDNFINQAVELYKDVLNDLEKKYLISATYLDENKNYLVDVADDVEVFFNTLTKTENN